MIRLRALGALGLLFAAASVNAQVGSGAVAFNGGATQDFNTLANTGTSSVMPPGWYFREGGGSSTDTYQADDGTLNQANVMSYGLAGDTDRGLGVLPGNAMGSAGTFVADIGARLTNLTGATMQSLQVAFATEVWLYQGAVGERFSFQYSTDATSLTTGTWTAFEALDMVTPAISGNGKKNGNLPENRAEVVATITGLNVAPGADLWVRWRAPNVPNNDNGLALDDVVFGVPVDYPPSVVSSDPVDGATDVPVTKQVQLTFSENVTLDDAGITLSCEGVPLPFELDGSGNDYSVVPDAPLPYGADCELLVESSAATDLDGTPDPMDADFVLAFGVEPDLAPTLAASVPADGSSSFPANANLQLTFSEPVTLASGWFSISCSVTGTRDAGNTVVAGGPSHYTLNPDADLQQGESCVLTLVAAQITDQDGTAHAYDGPATISFTVAAPVVNPPPAVVSTNPADGANDFPALGSISVVFSEPVTLQNGAFSLSCTMSTGISLGHALTGTSFTVTTGTMLQAEDSCTFSIDRTRVQDADGASPVANTVVNFTVAASTVGGYYSQVNTSSPEQLRCSLHEIIKGHTKYPYGWVQLEVADQDPNDPNKILDIYRNCSYTKVDSRVGNGGAASTCGSVSGLRYNREHVWPRSLGFRTPETLAAHNDLHMLHLSDEGFNANRGNKPFAYCPKSSGCLENRTITNNGDQGGDGTYPGNSNWYTSTDGSSGSYEVWHRWRGNMARALFYMAIRYEGIAAEDAHDGDIPDLELTDNRSLIEETPNSAAKAYMGLLGVLLEWHEQDPVDARELERNEIVYGFQGNRNPFIDHPEWATRALFESTRPATCVMGSPNTAPQAVTDSYAATEDQPLTVAAAQGVLANDSDADGNPLTAVQVSPTEHGALALAANGGFTYQPAADFCGTDGFTYRASDGMAQSAVAGVTIVVDCVNDAPVAVGTLADRSGQEGVEITAFSVAAGFNDVDQGDTLEYSAAGLPTGLTIDASTGDISGTPAPGSATGSPYTVTITATDGAGATAQQAFQFTIEPEAVPQDAIFADGFED